MKVGDLVKRLATEECGVIVDIDPLRNRSLKLTGKRMNEIVILLPCGTMWHAAPAKWEVISESR